MSDKWKSRKFAICSAAFLASVATGIAGNFADNEVIGTAGIICGILSAGIYAACEASVDRASIQSVTTQNTVVTTTSQNVEAKSDDVMTVAAVLAPAPVEEQQPVMEDE